MQKDFLRNGDFIVVAWALEGQLESDQQLCFERGWGWMGGWIFSLPSPLGNYSGDL